jgi:hypothetical protein
MLKIFRGVWAWSRAAYRTAGTNNTGEIGLAEVATNRELRIMAATRPDGVAVAGGRNGVQGGGGGG